MHPVENQETAVIFSIIFALLIVVISLAAVLIQVLIWCKIFSKAGYSWLLGLLMLVPVANVIMPFIAAFGSWPVLTELNNLKMQLKLKNQPQTQNK